MPEAVAIFRIIGVLQVSCLPDYYGKKHLISQYKNVQYHSGDRTYLPLPSDLFLSTQVGTVTYFSFSRDVINLGNQFMF